MDHVQENLSYTEVTTSYEEEKEPKLVKHNLASSTYAYLMRLLQLGALEGALGETEIHPSVKPLIEAMHHVLAGGGIEIKIIQEGNPDITGELNGRLRQANKEANALNKKAGYRLLPWC